MSFFAQYIHPLTMWLQHNPNWSLFFTFFIALAESLAIIGSIVPGSVTMTAIGILAGSGIMRIDLTLIASSLGAICGDSLSYALGYFYSDRLIYMWPFKKYPRLLEYGQEFFTRHGGKSVLIGRFVGPLRSIIPVIAGIVHMKQWRFFIANSISAVGWSLLYVMPGVLIGAAGHELSSESATRLFILILLFLLGCWVITFFIKWVFLHIYSFLKKNLHTFWCRLQSIAFVRILTPKEERNHYATAGLALCTLVCLLTTILFSILLKTCSLKALDVPIFLFLQSIHTYILEIVFIACTQLTSTITIASVYCFCCIWFLIQQNKRGVLYLSFLIIISSFIAYTLNHFIDHPRPAGLMLTMTGDAFPHMNLLIATALYGFVFYLINSQYIFITTTLRSIIIITLGLSGFGAIYLGDYWLSDILATYFAGTTLCLIFCLFYRKTADIHKKPSIIILYLLITCIISSSLISLYCNFSRALYAHTPNHQEYILEHSAWWDQQSPLLPLYRMNRVGKNTSMLNIQYLGSLNLLSNALTKNGWTAHPNDSILKKIMVRLDNSPDSVNLPLLTQLYQNNSPSLIMTYKDNKTGLELQLLIWKSNYHLYQSPETLWIGTAYVSTPNKYTSNIKQPIAAVHVLDYISLSSKEFVQKKIAVPLNATKHTLFLNEPYLLLIKSNHK